MALILLQSKRHTSRTASKVSQSLIVTLLGLGFRNCGGYRLAGLPLPSSLGLDGLLGCGLFAFDR